MSTTVALSASLEAFRHRYDVPAVGAALVTTDAPPRVEVTGARVRGGSATVTTDDLWHIGSCGKAMTAALIGRFVDRGGVDWDTPVPDLFPDLNLDLRWRDVSLAQVLTHRSGLPADPGLRALRAAFTDTRPLIEQRTALAEQTFTAPPRRTGRFRYSNLGYTLAGAIVDRLADRPYEEVIA